MKYFTLQIRLLSDATFGRGDGVAGLVDVEVQHGPAGLPYLGGRALKGLLASECDDIVFALREGGNDSQGRWAGAAQRIFGVSGAGIEGAAKLRIGSAHLPSDLQAALMYDIEKTDLTRRDVLDTLTEVRQQTAMDETGAPRRETLRSLRVILRDLVFDASLNFRSPPDDDELALLAATVKAFRRAGTGRNRGRGKLEAMLLDDQNQNVTDDYFDEFRKEVGA
jgi:hypothetical protein